MSWITKSILQPIADVKFEPNEINSDVFNFISRAIEFHLKDIVQEAKKVQSHTKRRKLCTEDVNTALQIRSLECIYGFISAREIFKVPSQQDPENMEQVVCGGQDEEIELEKAAEAPLPRLPVVPSYTLHWLAVEASQPNVPQNPTRHTPNTTGSEQRKRKKSLADSAAEDGRLEERGVVPHALSSELQAYYRKCVAVVGGEDDSARAAAMASLASDAGLQELLPYLTRYLAREVAANLRNLPHLCSLMTMLRCILQNPHFHPDLYLHQIMPPVLTCLVGRGLCAHPAEDHWSLRCQAARLAAYICRRFGEVYTTLQPRVSKTLFEALNDETKPLPTHYGAIVGLTALGPLTVEQLLLPHLSSYVKNLEKKQETQEEEPPPVARKGCKSQLSLEVQQCYSALQEASGQFLQHLAKDFAGSTKKKNLVLQALGPKTEYVEEIMSIFGESLIPYYLTQTSHFSSTYASCFL